MLGCMIRNKEFAIFPRVPKVDGGWAADRLAAQATLVTCVISLLRQSAGDVLFFCTDDNLRPLTIGFSK